MPSDPARTIGRWPKHSSRLQKEASRLLHAALGGIAWPVDDGGNHAYVVEPESGLFPVKRSLEVTGSRKGLVVDLCRIWRPVDAIPYFGGSKNSNWTMETSVELAKTLLVNPYHEKDLFYTQLTFWKCLNNIIQMFYVHNCVLCARYPGFCPIFN